MVNKVRTVDFLPEIFQTETNKQFLSATLDVLTQPQQLDRVQGFIGEKYGYGVASSDKYVVEPTETRSDYQLSPSVVFLKPDTQTAQDFIDYPGILKALQNDGAITNNHQRLFGQEFYSWDGFIDYDKIVNYGQYYWIPDGPDSVLLDPTPVPTVQTITVTRGANGYTFSNLTTTETDQDLTLVRGGVYTFVVNQDANFWIQGVPGLSGLVPTTTVDARDVYGVVNNGQSMGTITFTVPAKDAQNEYIKGGSLTTDLVSTSQFSDINGRTQSSANPIKVDGVTLTDGTTIIFYNNGDATVQNKFWDVVINQSTNVITLVEAGTIFSDIKITAKYGDEFKGQTFFRSSSTYLLTIIPYLSSLLDTIYYQDGENSAFYGQINLIADNASNYIDLSNVIGQKQYTSPNGINLTNGLKVRFNSRVVPSTYADRQFYVEGVGSSIALLPVSAFQVPETQNYATEYTTKELEWDVFVGDYGSINQEDLRNEGWGIFNWSGTRTIVGTDIDYITVSRNSRDYNGWSRSNRWFHQDVIDTVIAVNGYISNTLNNNVTRAQRPIVEYNGNLTLVNSGQTVGGVDLVSTTITDAFSSIQNASVLPYTVTGITKGGTTVVQTSTPTSFEDGSKIIINGVVGMYQINLIECYTKTSGVTFNNIPLSKTNIGLYLDANLTMPLDSNSFGTYISGGKIQYDYFIDGIQPADNSRVLFVNDTTSSVRSTVYAVTYLTDPNNPNNQIISLNKAPEFDIVNGNELYTRGGLTNGGKSYVYNGVTKTWQVAQYKQSLNEYPLFDLVDDNGYSLQDPVLYPESTFIGSKLFSYTPSNGSADPVLGFPIKYSSIGNTGDINFTLNYNADKFTYKPAGSSTTTTKNVNTIGYVEYSPTVGTTEYLNGWVNAVAPSSQYQVFQYTVEESFTTIVDITKSTPAVVVTNTPHNFIDRTPVVITGAYGMTDVNNVPYFAKVASPERVELYLDEELTQPVDTTGFNAYTGNGVLSTRGRYNFLADVPADTTYPWAPVQVYVGGTALDNSGFTVELFGRSTLVTLTDIASVGEKITVLIFSQYASTNPSVYYQYPTNLENNPFNEIVTNLDVGDIRNHYTSIFNNVPNVQGSVSGSNNLHNLGDVLGYGNQIIQNSASLVLPGLFTRKPELNLFNAIQYSSQQYTNYKQLITDLAGNGDYSAYQSAATILDDIIQQIVTTKTSQAFFWSDMVPSGNPYIVNTYYYEQATNEVVLSLSQTYNYTVANYSGICIYLSRSPNNAGQDIQLVRGVDYVVSDISPAVTITYPIEAGQSIIIKEYNQTYGSFCPNTPTKLGVYGSFQPQVVYDTSYTLPTWFIQGHDGSYTKLYGTYDPITQLFTDFRDSIIFEFETRVFNNLKLDGHVQPLVPADILPGQFRSTGYSNDDILQIYSSQFLNWCGQNRIDYKDQIYSRTNQFTYNYNRSSNKLDDPSVQSDTALKQGYWRGVNRWLYDTDEPNIRPWEMLGFTIKPTWWDGYYNANENSTIGTKYTSTNTLMWNDLARGFVYNDGNSYIDPLRVRPRLMEVLPVDAEGNLLSPLQVVVSNYDQLTFERDWVVGDQAPAETAYLKSSTWPFDYARLLALTKPAEFFNYYVDQDAYQYNTTQQQYLYNGHTHLDPRTISIYGNGTAKTSYIDWVVDYMYVSGGDAYTTMLSYLQNLDVRLTYRLAGFSDKTYLKFLVEKATPNDTNNSLLIPNDSYALLLYDDVPEYQINYTSVIIQKSEFGWQVWGNSQSKAYFEIAVPKMDGQYRTITANGVSVTLSGSYYEDRTSIVPYGTTFYSLQGISEFMQNYGRRMTSLGVGYDPETGDGTSLALWDASISRFLVWSQQSWENGTTITINPFAQEFSVDAMNYVVQPLTMNKDNFVLNQNLYPIQQQNVAILRNGTAFNLKILNPGDTVSYTSLNLHQVEHAVVFDNYTVFNDTIYNLASGLRQQRLLLQAYITAEWNGFLDANGFIINQDNIKPWSQSAKYTKGQIVTAKGFYWVANEVIEASATFNENQWTKTSGENIQFGILPNPSAQAYEASLFYDINTANLEQDSDLLSFSLIGYRPRPYMSAADLTDITQVNVYKNILKQKGTNLIANSFKSAQFTQGKLDYNLREVWAIKNSTFGSVLNSNFVEFLLNQNKLNSNPSAIGFTTGTTDVDGVQQTVNIADFINYERAPTSANFLPETTTSYTVEHGLPSAGFVNLNDAKLQIYSPSNLNDTATNYTDLYRKDNIWIANYEGGWGIFSPSSVDVQVLRVVNNLNDTITINFSGPHGLEADNIIAILNFNELINRYYTISSVPTLSSVVVSYTLDPTLMEVVGDGVAFKLVSQRADQPSNINDSRVEWSEFYSSLYWVDNDTDGYWSVYKNSPVFEPTTTVLPSTPVTSLGNGVITRDWLGTVAAGINSTGIPTIYRIVDGVITNSTSVNSAGFGTSMVASKDQLFVLSSGGVSVYTLVFTPDTTDPTILIPSFNLYQTINVSSAGALAVSDDSEWLYVSGTDVVNIYGRSRITSQDGTVLNRWTYSGSIQAPNKGVGFGDSITTSSLGEKIIIGAPLEQVGTYSKAGKVYVYSRGYNRWIYENQSIFFMTDSPTQVGTAKVSVNGIETGQFTIVDNMLTLTVTPTLGSIVEVEFDKVTLASTLVSSVPKQFGAFGTAVATNKYGSNIVVGAPGESHLVDDKNVGGAVYVFINSGQRYGSVTGSIDTVPTVYNNEVMTINGYQVVFAASSDPVNIAEQINTQTPTNILAGTQTVPTVVNGVEVPRVVLTINIITGSAEIAYDVIDIVAPQVLLNRIGFYSYNSTDPVYQQQIPLYTKTQLITSLYGFTYGNFGSVLAMNENNGLAIAATLSNSLRETTFDFIDDLNDNDTVFDNGATIFVENNVDTGAVYEYQYLPAYNENISNPGQYIFGQNVTPELDTTLLDTDTNKLAQQPRYGQNISFYGSILVVGSPNLYASGKGSLNIFNSNGKSTWEVNKHSSPVVNINSLSYISIYDTANNETLDYLDYIDPVQGVMLGAVMTNLDFWQDTDPAGYGLTEVSWGEEQVGRTWLDTTNIRILNYHQPDLAYNAKYWAQPFPGSAADIYTWVSSTLSPLDYAGPGYVTNFDDYVEEVSLDNSTNSLVTTYYYWVKAYPLVPVGKTLSPFSVAQYILNPLSSGIPFLAPLSTSSVGLYNTSAYLNGESSALHVGYSVGNNGDIAHQSWTLIDDNDADSFLPGLPQNVTKPPSSLYLKLLDSFSGYDSFGRVVPEPNLPPLLKYGVDVRPRQSMFPQREAAIFDYLSWVNNLLADAAVTETRNLSFLNVVSGGCVIGNVTTDQYGSVTNVAITSGGSNYVVAPTIVFSGTPNVPTAVLPRAIANLTNGSVTSITIVEPGIGYGNLTATATGGAWDTANYWTYENWWATGYSDNTKPDIEVPYIVALYRVTPFQGMIARVTSNYQGNGETFRWTKETGWYRIGLDNGTIKFNSNLWTEVAPPPVVPIRSIIRWINEELFTQDYALFRNTGLMLLFNIIAKTAQEGGNYLPWLNKTSFVDVEHTVRQLLQYKKFQRDNTEFLAGYLNEIKPYHVVIKDFAFRYTGIDVYTGSISDYDLPSQYNPDYGRFISPQLIYTGTPNIGEYLPNSSIWSTPAYTDWFNNFGLSISDIDMGNVAVTTTSTEISLSASTIPVVSTYGMPEAGIIQIDSELIKYNNIDRYRNMLIDLTRNYAASISTVHPAGSSVFMDLPSVIVLDPGRGYLNPPTITVSINTDLYPVPTATAELQAVMGDVTATPPQDPEKMYGVTVLNAGRGYAIKPTVHIEPSIVSTITSADPTTNVLSLAAVSYNSFTASYPSLQNGDSVIYRSSSVQSPSRLTRESYYYSRIVQCDLLTDTWVAGTTYTVGTVVKYRHIADAPYQQYTCTTDNTDTIFNPVNWELNQYVSLYQSYNDSISNAIPFWVPEFVYVSGDDVEYNGYIYENKVIPTNIVEISQSILAVVTVNSTANFVNGTKIQIDGVDGMTQVNGNQYYVEVISATQLGLYGGFANNVLTNPVNSTEFNAYVSNGFVNIVRTTFEISDWRSIEVADFAAPTIPVEVGSDGMGTLNLTPRIAFFTTNRPTREMRTTVKFDRTTYTSKIVPWIPSIPTLLTAAISDNVTSFRLVNSSLLPLSGTITLPGGTVTAIATSSSDDTITLASTTDMDYLRVGDPIVFNTNVPFGIGITSGQTYYIISSDSTNDTITISNSVGGARIPLTSTTVQFSGQLASEQIYYINNNISTNTISNVVRGANGSLAQPHIAGTPVDLIYNVGALVLYPNTETRKLYRCLVENTDETFTYNDWVQVTADDPQLSAADRVAAFYRPTIDMPGVDLTQLMDGVEYPNNTYTGPNFGGQRSWDITKWDATSWDVAPLESDVDTALTSPNFTNNNYNPQTNPNYVDVIGTPFSSGYGPEELVAGLTYDVIDINVRSKPGSSWNPLTIINNSGDNPTRSRTPRNLQTRGSVNTTSLVNVYKGQSVLFGGINSYLTTPYINTQFDFGANPFTIEFWMLIGKPQNAQIISNAQTWTTNGWSVGITDDNRITFISDTGSGLTTWRTPSIPSSVLRLSTFTNVSIVRTGTNLTAYVGPAGELNTAYRMTSADQSPADRFRNPSPIDTVYDITAVSNTDPCTVTIDIITYPHLYDGQEVTIAGALFADGSSLDGTYFAKQSTLYYNRFDLYEDTALTIPVDTTTFGAYVSGGTVTVYQSMTIGQGPSIGTSGGLQIFNGEVQRFNGYLQELRISNTQRYTQPYTPAVLPFANDSNTLLLVHPFGPEHNSPVLDDVGTTIDATGFAVSRFDTTVSASPIGFSNVSLNPVGIDVYVYNGSGTSPSFVRSGTNYQLPILKAGLPDSYNYTVDWDDQTITFDSSLIGEQIQIVVYEFGGGNQLTRSNSEYTPLVEIPAPTPLTSAYSIIDLNVEYSQFIAPDTTNNGTTVVVMASDSTVPSGLKQLSYGADYTVVRNPDGNNARIRFTTSRAGQYITYVLLGWIQTSIAPSTTPIVGNSTISFVGQENVLPYTVSQGDIITFDGGVNRYQVSAVDAYSITLTTPIQRNIEPGTPLWFYTPENGYSTPFKQTILVTETTRITYTLNGFIDPLIFAEPTPSEYFVVQQNNSRLIPVTDYRVTYNASNSDYEISLLTSLAPYDVITVTSFGSINQQSLRTQSFDGLTVNRVISVIYSPNSTTPVRVATSAAHNLTGVVQIKIDGVDDSTTPLNNNYYYAKVINATTVDLYYDKEATQPVALTFYLQYSPSSLGTKISYLFNAEALKLTQPSYFNLTDPARLWVTVNGEYINTEYLQLGVNENHNTEYSQNAGNELSILYPIEPTDRVIITSFTPSATPDEESFLISINYGNEPSLYRTNWNTRTYLTEIYDNILPSPSDAMYVGDITKLLSTKVYTTSFDSAFVHLQPELKTASSTTTLTLVGDSANEVMTILNKFVAVTGPSTITPQLPTAVSFAAGDSIVGITQASPAVITVADYTNYVNGAPVIITGARGMSEINGNLYYVLKTGPAPSGNLYTMELYSDAAMTVPVDSTSFGIYDGGSATISQVRYVQSYTKANDTDVTVTLNAALPISQQLVGNHLRVLLAEANFSVEQLTAIKESSTTVSVSGTTVAANGLEQNQNTSGVLTVQLPKYPQGNYPTSTTVGDTVLINGEYIKFLEYAQDDNGNWYIYGLLRGQGKTMVNTYLPFGTTVQGILESNRMPDTMYNEDWYDATDTPLQINNSQAAVFLRTPTF